MEVNIRKLEEVMAASNMRKPDLAKAIGIDRATFYRKIKSHGEKFTVGEMHKTVQVLGLSTETATEIFLFQNSQ